MSNLSAFLCIFIVFGIVYKAESLNEIQLEAVLAVISHPRLAMLRPRFVCDVKPKHLSRTANSKATGLSSRVFPFENVIFCADDQDPNLLGKLLASHPRNAVSNNWLVCGSNVTLEKTILMSSIAINQIVLFLDLDDGVLSEVYQVNNITVRTHLGKIEFSPESSKATLHLENEESFTIRRFNLQGLRLRTHILKEGFPTSFLPEATLQKITYQNDSKGALVANITNEDAIGVFPDILKMLEHDLNFTAHRLMRADSDSGFPIFVNGSFVGWSGMIGDLASRDVDLIGAPIVHTIQQYSFMAFFHSMGTLTTALFVGAQAGQEEQEWLTYLLPFDTSLWLLLFINCLVAAVAIRVVHMLTFRHGSNIFINIIDLFQDFNMVFLSYFGRASTSNYWNSVPSRQIFLFVLFLFGNLVFMSYKAALTSELSTRRQILPFDSAEGFYNSEYGFVYTWTMLEQIFAMYSDYPHMHWLSKSFYEHDNNEFYPAYDDGLAAISVPYSQKAFLDYEEALTMYPAYSCKVSKAWYFTYALPLTMTMYRGSPYFDFLNFAYLKRIEDGNWDRINRKYYGEKMDCPKEFRGSAIGISKVLSATCAYAIAMAVSILIMAFEIIYKSLTNKHQEVARRKSPDGMYDYLVALDERLKELSYVWGPDSVEKRYTFKLELLQLVQSTQFERNL